ncbi:ATP-binding protein [Rossellomorea marisflavi]|uniref:ATP-binding protein n=1 Tax=Rossellomorea marisflavi TaxID=189381 RepID=UPI002853583D|nr:ATP-binding protein [Rossellomorea marisflavi]MDR4938235.1 ATP-binding protein [Rossellomorea marisflavi]
MKKLGGFLTSNKVIMFFKVVLGFSITIVILSEVDKFKLAVKNTYLFMQNNDLIFGLTFADVLNLSYFTKKLSIIYIIIFIVFILTVWVIRKTFDKISNYRPKLTNPFEASLFKYLNSKDEKKVYLVTGEWGSGKTYIVSNFLKKYFKYSNRKTYYISCFGLESREQVLKEIKEQLELNDNSFLNLLQYFPVVGQPIYSLIKQTYSLSTVKANSIFIFDDFERISSLGLRKHSSGRDYYRKTSSLNRGSKIKELDDINKEFKKIQESLSRLQKNEEEIYYLENYQRYNVVTGFINELVETYNQKVIIVCNVDILGYEFVDIVFRGKLDCITYTKTVDSQTIDNLSNHILNNQVFSNNIIKRRITNVLQLVLQDFGNVIEISKKTNLRHTKSILQSFVDTAEYVLFKNPNKISDNYLISLFYSIVTVKFSTDERKIEYLNYMNIGGNLEFYLKLYNSIDDNTIRALSSSKYFSTLRWTGTQLSGYWLLNMTKPQEVNELVSEYNNYLYTSIESDIMLDENYQIENDQLLLLEHIFYLMEVSRKNGNVDVMSERAVSYLKSSNIESLLLTYENPNSKNIPYRFLTTVHLITRGSIYQEVFKTIFEEIYNKYGVERIEEKGYIFEQYNQFVSVLKNPDN